MLDIPENFTKMQTNKADIFFLMDFWYFYSQLSVTLIYSFISVYCLL